MNNIMLTRIIESLWHDYIYVICSSFIAPVLSTHSGQGQSFKCMCISHRTLTLDLL